MGHNSEPLDWCRMQVGRIFWLSAERNTRSWSKQLCCKSFYEAVIKYLGFKTRNVLNWKNLWASSLNDRSKLFSTKTVIKDLGLKIGKPQIQRNFEAFKTETTPYCFSRIWFTKRILAKLQSISKKTSAAASWVENFPTPLSFNCRGWQRKTFLLNIWQSTDRF